MSYYDDVMRIMSDGSPHTTSEVVELLYPNIDRYERKNKIVRIGRTLLSANRHRDVEIVGVDGKSRIFRKR